MGMIAKLVQAQALVAGVLLLMLGPAAGLIVSPAVGASARVSASAAPAVASGPAIPQPRGGARLRSVRCVSRTSCWAVGSYHTRTGSHNEVLHWNGRGWSRISTPSPGSLSNLLESVSCTSASNCWAVGATGTGSSDNPTVLNEALHWDGHSWSTVFTPDPGGIAPGDTNLLHAVACPSPASCWAVGAVFLQGFAPTNQVLHWDGHTWSQVSAPTPGAFSALSGARCLSPADCWAVGYEGNPGLINDQALHWDGRTWSLVATPRGRPSSRAGGLSGVRCTSRSNCWAVGSRGVGRRLLNEALHWNGQNWSRVSVPNPGRTSRYVRNALKAVSCTSAVNCWAVGSHQFNWATNSAVKNQVLHWDGRSWSRVFTPNPGGTVKSAVNQLDGAACARRANCWAVGSYSRPQRHSRNQILHWDGTRWSKA